MLLQGHFMKTIKLIPLFAASSIVAGCSNVYHHKDADFYDVKTTPPLHLLEVSNPDSDKTNLNKQLTLDFTISDQRVYKFTYLVEDTMRKRVDHGRAWEEGLSAMQVILAAFASAFSAGTGVHPDVVTTLAGLSALTPDIADIINAGDKAKAYSQGLELIETANSTYISVRSSVVSDSDKLIPSDKLSPEGAALFVSVMSTLKVMRNALLQTLPSEEDLAKATGKYSLFSLDTTQVNIELAANSPVGLSAATAGLPTALTEAGQNYYTRVVSVVRGGKLAQCTSDAPSVAVVTACSGSSMTVQPKMFGTAHVTVVAENGSRAVVKVLVK